MKVKGDLQGSDWTCAFNIGLNSIGTKLSETTEINWKKSNIGLNKTAKNLRQSLSLQLFLTICVCGFLWEKLFKRGTYKELFATYHAKFRDFRSCDIIIWAGDSQTRSFGSLERKVSLQISRDVQQEMFEYFVPAF